MLKYQRWLHLNHSLVDCRLRNRRDLAWYHGWSGERFRKMRVLRRLPLLQRTSFWMEATRFRGEYRIVKIRAGGVQSLFVGCLPKRESGFLTRCREESILSDIRQCRRSLRGGMFFFLFFCSVWLFRLTTLCNNLMRWLQLALKTVVFYDARARVW